MDVAELRRRMPRAEREEQLLSVAQAVFSERGFRSPSMDEIALRAGVTKPVLYDHFGSKDGLVAACLRRAGEELLRSVVTAVADAGSPEETLRGGFTAFFAFIELHGQGWFTLVGENSVVGPAAVALESIRRQQAAYVAEQLAVIFTDAASDDLGAISQAVIGAAERLALWRRERPGVTVTQAADALMSLVWLGLRARLPAGSAPEA